MTSEKETAYYSEEAEVCLIGAALIHGGVYDQAKKFISAEDFYLVKYAEVWKTIGKIAERGEPVSYATVLAQLQSDRKTGIVNSADLGYVISHAATWVDWYAYCMLVKRLERRRRLLELGQYLRHLTTVEELDLDDVIAKTQFSVDKWITESKEVVDPNRKDVPRAMADIYSDEVGFRLDDYMRPHMRIVKPFLNCLEQRVGGYLPGDLVYVGGRSRHGKSLFMLNQAYHAANLGKVCLYFSLEMSDFEHARRLNQTTTGISSAVFRQTDMDLSTYEKLLQGYADLAAQPHSENLYIQDQHSATLVQIKTSIQQLIRERGQVDLVLIDHKELIQAHGDDKVDRAKRIGEMLKGFAKELQTTIMVAVQYTKEAKNLVDVRPTAEMAYGGVAGTLHIADIMFNTHVPDQCDDHGDHPTPRFNEMDIYCDKFRGGKGNWMETAYVDRSRMQIVDMQTEHFDLSEYNLDFS